MIILKARKRVYPTHLIFAIGTLFYATLMVVSNGKEFFIPFFACLAGFVFFTALFYGEEVIVDGHRLIVRRFFFGKRTIWQTLQAFLRELALVDFEIVSGRTSV